MRQIMLAHGFSRRDNRPTLTELPLFVDVSFQHDQIWFVLSDGRTIVVPLSWSKLLSAATSEQRNRYTLSAYNIFRDELDEIIGVENVLYGRQGFYL